ncbi:RES family NAD+ phosphorylase [Sphingomonas aurantiaca]|uniref:RES family NAD+ phosphorylase n=1 Tax=Sphingomonas aurantiaca TaxID=185949 RepID=UPI002FE12684
MVDLPPIPGFFSTASRPRRQYLSFLHAFARRISLPVPRNDRTNVNYLPTQVFTEFLRDADFDGRRVDGIRYPSATGEGGSNVVLFATQTDVRARSGRRRTCGDSNRGCG